MATICSSRRHGSPSDAAVPRGELTANARVALPPMRFAPLRRVIDLEAAARSRLAGSYRAADGITWTLVDAGAIFYLVRPDAPPIALRASAPTELFAEVLPILVRFELPAAGGARSLQLVVSDVASPPAVAVPR